MSPLQLLKKPLLIGFLIWIFCLAAGSYIRLYPSWGHIWSPSNEQATMAVIFNIKKTFLSQIHLQYPQMSFEEADNLASKQLNETLRNDPKRVQQAIEKVSQTINKQSSALDQQRIYLLEADPFYYYNLTEQVTKTGRIAQTIKGNKYFNPLMGAPTGYWQPLTIHPYVGFLIYKTMQVFDPQVPLMSAVAFTPVVVSALGLAAFIWCANLLFLSWPSILTGCFFLAMAPIFLKRSALGWYDTDPYNILFPFLFLGLYLKGMANKPILYGSLLAAALVLYSLLWQGWILLFFITFIIAFACLFTKERANVLKLSATCLGATVLVGLLIYGFDFFTFFTEGAGELLKFTVKGMGLWPNLFIEVGELKKSSLGEIMSNTGGPVFILGALLGLFYSFKNFSSSRLILGIFLLITVVLTFKAERFCIFTLLPLSLLFAIGLEHTLNLIKSKKSTITIVVVSFLLTLSWIDGNKSIRTILTPIYNSAWDEALNAIRAKTPSDSTINTWWPPGHFIKATARRKVPFDGASLSEGQTGYWMANILLSTNEDKARGLLRMLNLSGNRPVELLNSAEISTSQAVALLHLIASQSPTEARETLKPFLKNEDINHLLMLTHGGSPHSYILVYNELVDQNVGLTFVGRRNLKRIEEINANPDLAASLPSPDSPEFIDFLWSLSGGPSKYSSALNLAGQDDLNLSFAEGLTLKRDMSMATVRSSLYGNGIPQSIVYLKDGHVTETELVSANLNYSVLVYINDGQITCRFMDRELANSLMMKLFYFDAKGLKNFKLTTSSKDLTGRTEIKVFETLWN